jgi:hypothetical protein
MLKNNIYNIDMEFDYSKIEHVKFLEETVKQEGLKKRSDVHDDVIFDYRGIDDNLNNVDLSPIPPLLKLKIRNTTQYLNWRLLILRRDSFTCQICHTSIKDNKSLRLEVYHAKTFNEICKENNVTTVKEALPCKELSELNDGISICYRCHKDLEKLRTKLRNMFIVRHMRKS